MSEFKITQTSYDFTSKRVSATIIKQDVTFGPVLISINIPFESPPNVAATDLQPLVHNVIRKVLIESAQFNS